MWPALFGPGWVWGVLTAGAFFAGFVAFVWFCGRSPQRPDVPDSLQRIWHGYEQGSLTRQEFERLTRPHRGVAAVSSVEVPRPHGHVKERLGIAYSRKGS